MTTLRVVKLLDVIDALAMVGGQGAGADCSPVPRRLACTLILLEIEIPGTGSFPGFFFVVYTVLIERFPFRYPLRTGTTPAAKK